MPGEVKIVEFVAKVSVVSDTREQVQRKLDRAKHDQNASSELRQVRVDGVSEQELWM